MPPSAPLHVPFSHRMRCTPQNRVAVGIVAVVVSALVPIAGCGGPAAGTTGAMPGVPVPIITLVSQDDQAPATLSMPPGAAQVILRLAGDVADVDQLVAEIGPAGAVDRARRWPVDAAQAGADGVHASVTLPAYALQAGDYVVTVWRGDADAVRRYTFRVAP